MLTISPVASHFIYVLSPIQQIYEHHYSHFIIFNASFKILQLFNFDFIKLNFEY